MSTPTFAELGLADPLPSTLAAMSITAPSPVQAQAIPLLLAGHDLIASAPTGTGKTAAFLLPALQRLGQPRATRSIGPRVLVLTPTRELAQQVAKAAIEFSRQMRRVKTVCITGGEPYPVQNRLLAQPHEILVATPGRLMDQMRGGRIDFSGLEVLVLDEADRMFDLGFAEEVEAIIAELPPRQTVCFTATVNRNVENLARALLKEPQRIEVAREPARVDAIDQQVIYSDGFAHKRQLLSYWLADAAIGQAIVFTATKRDAEQIAQSLDDEGFSAVALHGDLQQRQRTRMLNRLRRGEARVLVATDVAARGLDVPAISHVFNFDLPRFAEDYVHRIGRTGRAGATGTAISFVSRDDSFMLTRIERFIGAPVKVAVVEGLEANFKPRPQGAGPRREGSGPRGQGAGRPGQSRPGARSGDRRFAEPRQGEARPAHFARGEGRPAAEARQVDFRRGDAGPADGRQTGDARRGDSRFQDRRPQGAGHAARSEFNGNRYQGTPRAARPEADGNRVVSEPVARPDVDGNRADYVPPRAPRSAERNHGARSGSGPRREGQTFAARRPEGRNRRDA